MGKWLYKVLNNDVFLNIALALIMSAFGFFIGRAQTGEQALARLLQIALPTLFLFLVFAVQRIAFKEITSLHSFQVVDGEENCETAIYEIVRNSGLYLYASGAVSRAKKHLSIIEEKVNNDSHFTYKRFVWGTHYSSEFEQHVHKLNSKQNAIFYYRSEPGEYLVVSDKEVFIKLPGMRTEKLDFGVRTTNLDYVKRYIDYINNDLVKTVRPVRRTELFKCLKDRVN